MDIQHLIAYSLFFLLVAIEITVSYVKALNIYKTDDTINNLVFGILTTGFLIIGKGTFLFVFTFFNEASLFSIEMTWWAWIILFVLNELIFFFVHWVSHTVRFFWAFHVTHHNSVNYNFSTAVRNNFLIQTFRYGFYIPLALVGFPAWAIILMDSIAYFYQLIVHTQVIRSWGFLENFMNTPSHHRVHHGSNPAYIDKNYGAILIIWDKLFGTFKKEDEPVNFGITKNIEKNNVIEPLFREMIDIGKDLGKAEGASDVFNTLFNHPAWRYKRGFAEH